MTAPGLDRDAREALRAALRGRYPWIDEPDLGPRVVDAGECDRCGAEARLVLACGPGAAPALGRSCASQLGPGAWCDGHAQQAREALRWLARLPAEADEVARLWWVATGEARVDPAILARGHQLGVLEAPGRSPDPSPERALP